MLRDIPLTYRGHVILDTDEGFFVAPRGLEAIPGDVSAYQVSETLNGACELVDANLKRLPDLNGIIRTRQRP